MNLSCNGNQYAVDTNVSLTMINHYFTNIFGSGKIYKREELVELKDSIEKFESSFGAYSVGFMVGICERWLKDFPQAEKFEIQIIRDLD